MRAIFDLSFFIYNSKLSTNEVILISQCIRKGVKQDDVGIPFFERVYEVGI